MSAISIEPLSVFGLPPVEFVELAARLGVPHIGLQLVPFPDNPHDYPRYSLRDDAELRRETVAALRDTGVTLGLGEGFMVLPGIGAAAFAHDLDLIRELGAPRINAISLDPDIARSRDEIARLVEMAAARGMATVLEFCPFMSIKTLADAVETVRHIGRDDVTIMVDTLHVQRSGASAADLAAVDPALIGYIQLCDAPAVEGEVPYGAEAAAERQPPGEGGLPLADMLAAMPRDVVVGLEVPMLSEAERGVDPESRMKRCVAGARRLLAEA